jgi:hypothetical protein
MERDADKFAMNPAILHPETFSMGGHCAFDII